MQENTQTAEVHLRSNKSEMHGFGDSSANAVCMGSDIVCSFAPIISRFAMQLSAKREDAIAYHFTRPSKPWRSIHYINWL
jgi:hypothetical protein